VNGTKENFIREIRRETREPFFDNMNVRRIEKHENKLFLNEFGDTLFLKNEVLGRRLITNKTMIKLNEKPGKLTILTISFMGDFGGLLMTIGAIFSLLVFIFVNPSNFSLLGATAFCYLISVLIVNSDFRAQNGLIIECIKKIKTNPNII
jgi:hypothetical protein